MSKAKKKSNRRSRTKYPGLVKEVNLKIRQELIDQDYIDKLSDKEKQWLSNFNREYVAAEFNYTDKPLHKSKKAKKDCYSRNNSRNRDIFSIKKSHDMLKDEKSIIALYEDQTIPNPSDVENAVIEMIDLKKGSTF